MKNIINFFIFFVFAHISFAQSSIYLDQISTSGTTSITQTGGSNRIGSSGTPSTITGDSGTFNIRQIGTGNQMDFALNGDSYDFKMWNTGDSNLQKIYITGGNNRFDAAITGNANEIIFNSDASYSGTTAATSSNGQFDFVISGNTNIFEIGIFGGTYNKLDYNVQGNSNTFSIKQTGIVAGTDGHLQEITINGSSNTVTVDQSGTVKQTAILNLTGSSSTVTIIQSPPGS
jgi:hypothetical protein